ncbi:TetR/AcrR family transcriptional regulator [Streptomyces cadmiisoli]|uniref:TetR/AcrR family transcriptional regulator n=2 Tax=Streptomyces cadmiisoli TaxID=2184053 RepID=A0A2Z4J980_9ACTN|nr:TetR/AcrR family transcriptional regulator [Streptomyces cadmiisoli]
MKMPAEKRTRRAGGGKRLGVLDTAVEVLSDRGYESTRFADVAAASGTAVSTLQNYFGSREDMLIEALQRSTNQEVEALEALAAAQASPWEQLVALIDRSLGNSEQTQRMLVEFWRSAMRDVELREHSEQVQRGYREPFLRAIQEGCDQGLFHMKHSPEDVVDFLLTFLAGVTIPRVLHQDRPAEKTLRDLLLSQMSVTLGRET